MSELDLPEQVESLQQAAIHAECWWHGVVKIDPAYKLGRENLIQQRGMSYKEWRAALHITVPRIVATRHARLQQLGLLCAKSASKNKGRLLLFEPGLTMNDGLAEQESDGFFDAHNCPPSDFWLGFVTVFPPYKRADSTPIDMLISWVPTELQELAIRGINVIAENCSDWADAGSWKNSALTELLLKLFETANQT